MTGRKLLSCRRTAGLDLSDIEIIHVPDNQQACNQAVRLVRDKKADILMKGLVSTGILIKAMLDKENGLMNGKPAESCCLF